MNSQQKNAGLYALKVIKRLCVLLILCIIFFGIVFNIGRISVDDFKRMFVRIGNGLSADSEDLSGEIAVSDDPTMTVNRFKDGVAIATSDRLRVFDSSGLEFYSDKLVMANPVMRTSDKRIMVFDRGGKTLGLYTSFACISQLKSDNEIINASINDRGYIAVASQADGYKSMVTLYNANMKERYKYYSADGYVLGTAVYGAGKQLACSALTVGGNKCRISVFNTNDDAAACEITLNACFVYDLEYIAKERLVAVTDTGWYLTDTKTGNILDSGSYSGASLSCFDIKGSKGVFVFTDNGNKSRLNICDFTAGNSFDLSVEGVVQSIALDDGKAAVYSSDTLYCFDLSGRELYREEKTGKRIVDVSGKYIIFAHSGGISYVKMEEE